MHDLPPSALAPILPLDMPYLVGCRRIFRHILFLGLLVLPIYGCDTKETASGAAMDAAPGPVRAMGSASAPVTIIDYSSLTCPHCAKFHIETLPVLKANYIDTGKVRFLYRNFPLDGVAHKAAMLASCTSDDKYFQFLDVLFARQRKWAGSNDPRTELMNLGKMAGIDEKSFDACMKNSELADSILEERLYGEKTYEISSTPTLIIQGKKHVGALAPEDIDALLAPLLKEAEGN